MSDEGVIDKSPVARAVRLLGGSLKTASGLGIERYQTVQSWVREARVPANYAPALSEATGVPLWDLRPDDWHRIWPMLVGTEGAPAAPASEKRAA